MGVQDDYNEAWEEGYRSAKGEKSAAIELLEKQIAEKDRRIQELLEYNNQLLERARKAEGSKTITVSLETAEMIKAVRKEIDAWLGPLRPRHVVGPL